VSATGSSSKPLIFIGKFGRHGNRSYEMWNETPKTDAYSTALTGGNSYEESIQKRPAVQAHRCFGGPVAGAVAHNSQLYIKKGIIEITPHSIRLNHAQVTGVGNCQQSIGISTQKTLTGR
jgi:hypothetical protein